MFLNEWRTTSILVLLLHHLRKTLTLVRAWHGHKVWTSKLTPRIKARVFRACIEPILLYGSETWTFQFVWRKKLDCCYTRLLMRAQNLSWKKHPTLKQIYGSLVTASTLVRQRRVQFAGLCQRASNKNLP